MDPGSRSLCSLGRDDERYWGCAASWPASQHPQHLHIRLQDGFLLGALVGVLLAHPDAGAQRLDVVAVALGFGIDVADLGEALLLFLSQPLDALDDGLELVFGEFRRGFFR